MTRGRPNALAMPAGTQRTPAVVFDVDGVLIDSPHERAWREALAELAETNWRDVVAATTFAPGRFSTEVYQRHVAGLPRLEGARAALEHFGFPDAAAAAIVYASRKQRRLEALIAEGAFGAFPDALRFLLALRGEGVSVAAASSSKNADTMMRQVDIGSLPRPHGGGRKPRAGDSLLEAFDADVCGRDVAHGKPAPDLFLLAAAALRVDPAACVVVEDAPAGVAAAKAGGMRAIGVARLDDARLLHGAGADLVVTSLAQVAVGPLIDGRLEARTPSR
ncbi:MAG TPA: HAD-IA family hydrolase [Rhodospirillales bacterium]|nr:HAD-IA family hydrolase [Rhodospirillales bacterium]